MVVSVTKTGNDDTYIEFRGCEHFRMRLLMSTLSGKAVRIREIRSGDLNPGLADFEVSFLRLLEKVTNGSKVSINYTGTAVTFIPGQMVGGTWTHACAVSRTIGYYLEPMMIMAPFCKEALRLTLTGITHSHILNSRESSGNIGGQNNKPNNNPSNGKIIEECVTADYGLEGLSAVLLPLLENFGLNVSSGAELNIQQRCYCSSSTNASGATSIPEVTGKVFFTCPIIQDQLRPVQLTQIGRIQKIRGIAHSMNLSSSQVNRTIEALRSVLNRFIPDIFITTDVKAKNPRENKGRPGFGLYLSSISTTGQRLSVHGTAQPGTSPETFAIDLAHRLLHEIEYSGFLDTSLAHIPLIWMALTSADVSRIKLGPLSPNCVAVLRLLRTFFNVVFKIEPCDHDQLDNHDDDDNYDNDDDSAAKSNSLLLLTVMGCDYRNFNRRIK